MHEKSTATTRETKSLPCCAAVPPPVLCRKNKTCSELCRGLLAKDTASRTVQHPRFLFLSDPCITKGRKNKQRRQFAIFRPTRTYR